MATPLEWIKGIGTVLEFFDSAAGSNTAKFAGNMYANSQNAANQRTAAQNMQEKILMGRKYGIHPLESIGASAGPSPTIPMQNPFGGTTPAQPQEQVDQVEQETKQLILENLRRESKDSEHRNSLLVPVSLKPGGQKKYWGLNSHFFGYTFVASSIQAAANGKTAWDAILKGSTSLNKEQIEEIKRIKNKHKLSIPEISMGSGGM